MAGLLGQAAAAAIPGVGEVEALVGAIGAIFQEISGFVAKADPGAFKQLSLAFDNLQASIGTILKPVVDILIPVMDNLNVVFTAIGQAVQQLWSVMQPLVTLFTERLQLMAKIIGQLAQVVTFLISPLLKVIVVIETFIQKLLNGLLDAISKFLDFLGFKASTAKSTAAQGASTVSLDSLTKSLQEAALGGASRNYMEEIADNSAKNNEHLDKIKQNTGNIDSKTPNPLDKVPNAGKVNQKLGN